MGSDVGRAAVDRQQIRLTQVPGLLWLDFCVFSDFCCIIYIISFTFFCFLCPHWKLLCSQISPVFFFKELCCCAAKLRAKFV